MKELMRVGRILLDSVALPKPPLQAWTVVSSHLISPHLFVLPLLVGVSAFGCKDPETQDPETDQCIPVAGEVCPPPGETGDTGDTGETGGEPEPTPLAGDECVFNYNENAPKTGYRVQCDGELHTEIDFDIFGNDCVDLLGSSFCIQTYDFGWPYDTYEAPDVMACCGEEWDPENDFDVYAEYCTYDLMSQACSSLAKRLEKHVEDGDFDTSSGDFTDKGTNLQAWIAANYKACMLALETNDVDPDPDQVDSYWSIPNNAGADGWWPATGVTFYIKAGTLVDGVRRPALQQDWLECTDVIDNNDEIFEDQAPPKGGIVVGVDLAASVDGDLIGPSVGGGTVTASTTFGTACTMQGCPSASWSYNSTGAGFTLEEFRLYGSNFSVSNGTLSLTVDRARIELWTQAPGTKIFDGTGNVIGYEIAAGEAWFYLAGMSDGTYSRFMGVNSTDIEITEDGGLWSILGFDIESVDGANEVWTITLDDSRWN